MKIFNHQLRLISLFLGTIFSLNLFAQNGSVIVIQTKGVVEAFSPTGVKLTEPVVRGSVLPVGYGLKTGLFSESVLLFSNGTTATVQENSRLKLNKFLQTPFESKGNSFGQLNAEPSTSQVSLEMEIGSLVVQTKKLQKSSSFSITTPTGTAGIRGTQFQMAMSPNTGMQLDVAESQVAFTPAGKNQPVLVGPGRGLDASASGAVKQRPISPTAARNITIKNTSAASACAAVPVATSKEANQKAEKSAQDKGTDSDDSSTEEKDGGDSEQEADEDKQAQSSGNQAAESFIGRSSSVTQRSISAAEILRVQKENELTSEQSDFPPPPNVVPPGPPSTSPYIGKSVRYDYDADENIISIGLYEDGIPVPVEVSFLSLEDLNSEEDFELILSKFANWNADDELKLINAIGLDVFIEEIGLDPYKYDDFNVAIQHAISLAASFLEEVTLASVIPSDKVRGVQGLVDEFSSNPYAFEFAKLLAKHGAISNPSNQSAADNLLSILGSDNLSDSDYLSSLLNTTLLPGESYNSEELNGGLIGARNASIDADTAEKLQVRLDHVDALVGGDIFIESGATIDVSEYLPAKGENDGTKIFTIAAAKDLSIWGDVTFENDNHAEDHALALGAAGDLNIQAGSDIFYEGSNLGIGTAGDLELVDIDIDVGGNLAIGSLGDLDIEFTEPGSKLFSVGRYSDRDNVYLYANDLITAQGLRFNDRAREIYMEAITINLKDVNFPEQSEVMLRSQAGTIDFGTFDSPTIGGVNLTNVKHLGISTDRALQQTDFSGSSGKWNSTATQANGTPAVRVRAFSGANSGSGVN